MPQPTASDVHVNRPLTNYSVAFAQSQEDFLATRVFTTIPSQSRGDDYFVYDRADWARLVAEKRAPGTESAGGGYTLNTDTFLAERWSVHQAVDDPTRANADDPLDPDRDATAWVTEQMLRRMEAEFQANFFTTGVWTRQITPGTLWDAGGSTPISDIKTEIIRIAQITGKRPNTIATTPFVFNVLSEHVDVQEKIKYTQRAVVTQDLLASLLGVERFLVGWGFQTTSVEGAATDTFDFMLGKHLWLGYVDPNPGPRRATAGATFVWSGLTGASRLGFRIKRFRDEPKESDIVEGDVWFDMKIVANDLGMLFANPIS